MRAGFFFLTLLAFFTAVFLAFGFSGTKPSSLVNNPGTSLKKKIIKCGPDWEQLELYFEEAPIPPIAGSGNHKWTITTESDSAQFYFNQGINMYYSFHIIESMASFRKAVGFDPNSAMLYWAQALAYGPNINDLGYTASPEALVATKKAIELSGACSPKEQLLIKAMQVRYTEDSSQTREGLNQLYADKMKEAYTRYPLDPDVAALYADALMLQHPWDLWNVNGSPKPWTPPIRLVLEKLLARTPDHPGANHYYIHVMEPSPFAAKALPSADRLGRLTPGLSHTVHMPSHIYLRTGQYNKGVAVNENAVNSYRKIIPLYAPVAGNDFLYVIHNLHMQVNNAWMAGRMDYSVRSARETVNSIPADYLGAPGGLASYMQAIYMLPILTDVRFGRWNEVLQYPAPDASQVYGNVLYHFGRGMALTHQSKMAEANDELSRLRELMKDSVLQLPFTPFSPAIEGAKVAELVLTGNIFLAGNKYEEAIAVFEKASATEENMVYTEPRDWLLNPKHYLGKAFLLAGKINDAEKAFRRDLSYNNENVWALRGLYQALVARRNKEAASVLVRLKKASSKADIPITSPAF